MEDERGRIRPDLAAFNLREDPEASEVFGINIILEMIWILLEKIIGFFPINAVSVSVLLKVVFSELQDFVPFRLVGKHAAYQILLSRFKYLCVFICLIVVFDCLCASLFHLVVLNPSFKVKPFLSGTHPFLNAQCIAHDCDDILKLYENAITLQGRCGGGSFPT